MSVEERHLASTLSAEFGPWLRAQREQRGWYIAELADACNLSRGTLGALENNAQLVSARSIELFVRIAHGLDMDLGYVLHKAGFDVGASGLNLARLSRVETAVDVFTAAEGEMRSAISEAMVALDVPGGGEQGRQRTRIVTELGRALARLDNVTERLRRERFVASVAARVQDPEPKRSAPTVARAERTREPWTDEETQFLRDNPGMSHGEVGRQLSRSVDSVRHRRGALRKEGSL